MASYENEYKNKLIEELEIFKTFDQDEDIAKQQILKFLNQNSTYLGKDNLDGHVVASAWIVNKNRDKVILAHHKILDIWVQLGGHTDRGEGVFEAALREGYEESGLRHIKPYDKKIFDLDVHLFPQKGIVKGHYHFDIRYLFEADDSLPITISNESKDVKWVKFNKLHNLTNEKALFRMIEKAKQSV